jgi:multidrug efflux pump subunit AcrB
MLMAAILLLGLISCELLPVAALLNIDSADLPGADAQTVASTVTTRHSNDSSARYPA